jgi:uncharacterized protein YjbK
MKFVFFHIVFNILFISWSWGVKTHRPIWSSRTIELELKEREQRQLKATLEKLNEVMLYVSKNDLRAASAVMTAIKAKTTVRNEQLNYVDAYLDFRLKRFDSALRTLKNLTSVNSEVNLKRCTLWLKIAWDTKRWQEVNSAFSQCESTLSHYSQDDLFYTKTLLNFSSNLITEETVVPSPFFYFYAPDYAKIEQWLTLLIKQDLESIAIKHLQRIPDESLNKGNVRLLTAMALWNANDAEGAQALIDKIPSFNRNNWNLKRLLTSVALSNKNWQLAWDSNREVLDEKPHLPSAIALDTLLSWQMNLTELLKIRSITTSQFLNADRELTPLVAAIMHLRGLKNESHELLEKYRPYLADRATHHVGYWVVKQWVSIRGSDTAVLLKDAEESCHRSISFGCWLLLSGQMKTSLDNEELFPYDSVGDYFRENL